MLAPRASIETIDGTIVLPANKIGVVLNTQQEQFYFGFVGIHIPLALLEIILIVECAVSRRAGGRGWLAVREGRLR
jgi:hypothetical protein